MYINMVRKTDSICLFCSGFRNVKYFILSFMLLGSFLSGTGLLSNYDSRFNTMLTYSADMFLSGSGPDTVTALTDTSAGVNVYPARPMLMSLIVPGLGQLYNKSPWWKTTLFAGIEVAGIVGYWQWTQKANKIREDYEKFADDHWSLSNWVINTTQPPPWGNLHNVSDFRLDGGHKLILHLSGSLAEQFSEFVSSDSLVSFPDWIYSSEVTVVRDRDFYENIGKYDQFAGGWDDFTETWDVTAKDVGDSTEYIILTNNKKKYLNMRFNSNNLLTMAKYAVSAIMFNHVFSALDAIWSSQKKSRKEKSVDTNVGLIYDRKSPYGVGGVALVVRW